LRPNRAARESAFRSMVKPRTLTPRNETVPPQPRNCNRSGDIRNECRRKNSPKNVERAIVN
jgi:hypothetical protein